MDKSISKPSNPVAVRMKELRLIKELSQKGLGIAAGIDEGSASPRINQYERGKHTPDYSMLQKLAAVLEAPTAYFYAEDDSIAELILAVDKLSTEQRKSLISKLK